jgi:hypothetical protein
MLLNILLVIVVFYLFFDIFYQIEPYYNNYDNKQNMYLNLSFDYPSTNCTDCPTTFRVTNAEIIKKIADNSNFKPNNTTNNLFDTSKLF